MKIQINSNINKLIGNFSMSDDIAFKIQLGIILPKLKDTVGDNLSSIIEELVSILSYGTLDGEDKVELAAVKEIIMKDIEIFLDSNILPALDAKLNPPEPEPEAAEESAEEGEGEGEAEEAAE